MELNPFFYNNGLMKAVAGMQAIEDLKKCAAGKKALGKKALGKKEDLFKGDEDSDEKKGDDEGDANEEGEPGEADESMGNYAKPRKKKVVTGKQTAEPVMKSLPEKPAEGKPLPTGAHRTPPKGYPEGRKEYGIPGEYKYPLDTPEHVRAALSYFSKPANAGRYSPEERKTIMGRIRGAAKRHKIEVSKEAGPPGAERE